MSKLQVVTNLFKNAVQHSPKKGKMALIGGAAALAASIFASCTKDSFCKAQVQLTGDIVPPDYHERLKYLLDNNIIDGTEFQELSQNLSYNSEYMDMGFVPCDKLGDAINSLEKKQNAASTLDSIERANDLYGRYWF